MIDRPRIEVGLLPVEKPQLLQPLEQAGIDQESESGYAQKMTGAGDRASAAVEGQVGARH